MKKMKVLSVLIAILLVVGILAACSQPATPIENSGQEVSQAPAETASVEASEDITYTVGITYQGLAAPYVVIMKDAFEATADELGLKYIAVDGESDPSKQVGQVENFIAQKVDLIIVDPIEADGVAPAIDAANAAGIPVFCLLQKTSNWEESICFVGSKIEDSGNIVAQMAIDDGCKKLAVIEGPMGSEAQIGRFNGIKEIVDKYPDVEIVTTQGADWDRAKALSIAENWLQSGIEIDAIIGENDDMVLGAVQAVQEAGKGDSIKCYGIDALDEALTALENETMAGTVFQDAKGQGKLAAETALAILQGETVEKNIYIPYVEVRVGDVSKYR